jgi:hypothetical protein
MGPSLGSINRAVLLGCDFFLSPMSIDIFSLKAIENIATSLQGWKKKLDNGLSQADPASLADIPKTGAFRIMFVGYVAQNYIQKTIKKEQQSDDGDKEKREVQAFENIMKRIPKVIAGNIVAKLQPQSKNVDYKIGSIPNLYSLIPMAQTAHKPIFGLKAKDGVRGAHFNKVKDAEVIFSSVSDQLIKNVKRLSK